ncbi:MAG: PocR ligand-binding domain-containing protein [Bacteroidota bacterium]|nr:PocR ligand-binding domain-containing protein [Bacteroidota bacterium]
MVKLHDLIDVRLFQTMLDRLNEIYSFPAYLLDFDGNMLTNSTQQDICTKFHCFHHQFECIEKKRSVTEPNNGNNQAVVNRCPHGMNNCFSPIVIDGKHLGNFLTAPFFTEKPDLKFFREQATNQGFEIADYLNELEKVPVWSPEQLDKHLSVINNLIEMLANASAKELKEKSSNRGNHENETNYRLMFENVAQGFASHKIILDESGLPVDYEYLSVNPSFEKLTGLKASNVIGKPVKEIMPNTEKYWIDLYGKVALTGEAVQYENYSVELDKYFEVWAFSPRIGEFATVFTDITKRKRDEEIQKVMYSISRGTSKSNDLGELILMIQNQLESLIDVTNFYIALYDETSDSFTIPYYSDEKDDITSFPAGKSLSAYVINTKMTLHGKRADVDALKQAGLVESVGEPSAVWLGLPLLIKDKPIGVFALQSYVDENAFTPEDVNMLEFVSQQISSSIQQKKAEQEIKSALEKAEEGDRLKTSFLANMSHELRTPMNGIMGFAELLNDDNLSNEDRHEFINVINDSSQSLLDVITNIVDISKIDSRQIHLKTAPFNLNNLLDELLNWFSGEKMVKDKPELTIELVKELSDHQCIVVSDQAKIRHSFKLLLNNSGKFTKSGFIRFGYSVHGKNVRFFVQDTGKGIAPEKQCFIFEKFRQEDETLSRKYGGVGLGLTIAKGLVELIGGKIWVDSEPEKGTTVFFEIPKGH